METIFSRDNTVIAYRRSGTGPPLLLVHGIVSDHTQWDPLLPALDRHFTVYAMERRGRGFSGDADAYSIEREYEDIVALVESIGVPTAILGHSLGALCCLEATKLSSNISHLLLYESVVPGLKGTVAPHLASRLAGLLLTGRPKEAVVTFLNDVVRVPIDESELLQTLPTWPRRVATAHTIFREIAGWEELPPFDPLRFKSVDTPTLLITGAESTPYFTDFTWQLYDSLPNSNVTLLAGQKHMAMYSNPDLFLHAIFDFLNVEHDAETTIEKNVN